MIQLQSKLKIIDNSGGSVGRCIRVLQPHGRQYAEVGDVVLVSIIEVTKKASLSSGAHTHSKKSNMSGSKKETVTKGSIKRGTVSKALVVRTKCHGYKNAASFPDGNAVILLKHNSSNPHSGKNMNRLGQAPVGSRIKGPISSILKLTPSSPIYPSLTTFGVANPNGGGQQIRLCRAGGHSTFGVANPYINMRESLYNQQLYKSIMLANPDQLEGLITVDWLNSQNHNSPLIQPRSTQGGEHSKNVKLGEAAIQYMKVLALSKLHY